MNFRFNFISSLLVGVCLAGLSVAQVSTTTAKSAGKAFKAVALDTRNFNPQVNPSPKTRRSEREHEYSPKYLPGLPNNLEAGGTRNVTRADFTNSAFFPTIGFTGAEPPDPDIAVGPNHIVTVVNSDIAFYTKTGVRTLQQGFNNFFAPINPLGFITDPKVFFDTDSQRFFVVILGIDFTNQLSEFQIGVSATADPNGKWNLFKVSNTVTVGGNLLWLDYPGWGFSKTGVVATGNMFPFTNGNVVSQVFGFQKSELLGTSVTPASVVISDSFTIQSAKGDGNQSAVYAVANATLTSQEIFQTTITGTPGSTTMTINRARVEVPAWTDFDPFVIGPGNKAVQTNDPRILSSMSRTLGNGSVRLVAAHTVGTSSTDTRPASRWYEFDVTGMSASKSPKFRQGGTLVAPTGSVYFFPAIGINTRGDIGLTLSKVGASTPGDVLVAGRKSNDPLGTMSNPTLLEKSLSGIYRGFSTRWGDYFDVEIDPKDGRTFWAVGMGAGRDGSWQTFVKSFSISLADSDLDSFFALTASRFQGTLVSGNSASLRESEGNSYILSTESVKGLGQAAGVQATYKAFYAAGKTSELRIVHKISAPAGATGIFFLKNRSTGQFDPYTSVSLLPNPASSTTITLSADDIAKYVSATGDVEIIVRANQPVRNGISPNKFNLVIDQLKVLGYAPQS